MELTPLSNVELAVTPTQGEALERTQKQVSAQVTPAPEMRPKPRIVSPPLKTGVRSPSPQVVAQGRSCDQRVDCLLHGLCSEGHSERSSEGSVGGSWCAALKDKDCEGSIPCVIYGRCTARSSRCVATQERDCQASRGCRDHDRCSISRGRCVKLN